MAKKKKKGLTNKQYDNFKNFALIVLPAVITCVGTILEALNVSWSGVAITIMIAIDTCLGTIVEKLRQQYMEEEW